MLQTQPADWAPNRAACGRSRTSRADISNSLKLLPFIGAPASIDHFIRPRPFYRVKLTRSAISYAHDIVPEQSFFILDTREKRLESIARREDTKRLSLGIDDRNTMQFLLPYNRPDVIQAIVGPAGDHLRRHDHHTSRSAGTSLAMTDLSNDVCSRDHALHNSRRIANYDHTATRLEKEFRRLGQWSVRFDRNEAVTHFRQ